MENKEKMKQNKKWYVLYIGDDEEGYIEYAQSNDIGDLYQIIEEENLRTDEYIIEEMII